MKENEFFKLVSAETLSDNWGVLTRHTFELKRRDGSWQRQTREVYDRGSGAVALLYNPDTDCVLLTRQFRLPVRVHGEDGPLIEAPAGLLEGANPAARMRAELEEETGYRISELERLYEVFMSPGSVSETLVFFSGTYSMGDQVSDGGGNPHEGEDIEVLHVPLAEALQMIRSGEIRDAKTVMLLQELALRRSEGT